MFRNEYINRAPTQSLVKRGGNFLTFCERVWSPVFALNNILRITCSALQFFLCSSRVSFPIRAAMKKAGYRKYRLSHLNHCNLFFFQLLAVTDEGHE